jgi:DNA-binding MarR family transcriptional regulator
MAQPVTHLEEHAPLLRLLGLATRRLTDDLHERLGAAGFSDQRVAHHQVFAHVPPEGIRLTDLAERAGMTKQAMAELVDDAERLGYVTRTPDPGDRRAKRIELTGRGWEAVDVARAAFRAMEADLAERITPKHLRQLRRALQGVLDAPVDA